MGRLLTRSRLAPALLFASGLLVVGCGRSGLGELDVGGPGASGGVHTSSCTPGTTSGSPVVLATDSSQVVALAVDATDVYWLDEQGNVMRVSKCGGPATTLASAGTAYGSSGGGAGFAVGPQNAYWTDDRGDVLTVQLEGGMLTTLASTGTSIDMTLQGTDLYWVTSSRVEAMSVQGGAPSVLATPSSFVPSLGMPVADDTNIYWVAEGGIISVPRSGGTVTRLVEGRPAPGLAIDDANVYWSDSGDYPTAVLSTPKTGGPSLTLATDQIGATSFAVDAQNLYWTIGGLPAGAVLRVPVGGGAIVTLATGGAAGPITLDDTSVYWAEFSGWQPMPGTASVMRLSPK